MEDQTNLPKDMEREYDHNEVLEKSSDDKIEEKVEESNKIKQQAEPNKKFRHEIIHKSKKPNFWLYVSVILGILLIISLAWGRLNFGSPKATEKAVDYINNYVLDNGNKASIVETKEVSGLYKIKLNINGKDYDSYITKDGSLLFTAGIDITKEPSLTDLDTKQPSGEDNVISVSVDDDPSIGPKDAPITIIEFSDFQCPFCARAAPTVKQILKEYDGKVRFVYRDFPLSFHQNAQKSAEAAECADEQGKFWEYHDKLFENQNALEISNLKQYAKDLGLDSSKFDSCLDSGKYTKEVEKDTEDGQKYGVTGTPAFFINGKLVSGAQPFKNFATIIDSELKGK